MSVALFATTLLLLGGQPVQDPKSSVALCEGDSFYNCRPLCGGTLVAPNLVVTSRHCADVTQLDSLDCASYRFSGSLVPAPTIWVTVASPVSNAASFHHGLRWDIPLPIGCGHDLAFLTLSDAVPALEAAPASPATTHDAVRAIGAAAIDLYGYGKTSPDGPIDPQRRHLSAHVLCLGGEDSCRAIPGGGDLEPEELAVDAEVCPGDSGSGAFGPDGLLLGTLARSIGGTNVCADGVYTRLAPHGLLFARTATTAASLGAYPVPNWITALEDAGDSPTLAPKAFGAPCDGDSDCSSNTCRSFDEGLTWSCAKPCSSGCTCRALPDGSFCFDEPAPTSDAGCATVANDTRPANIAAFAFLAFAIVRRRRR